MLAVRMHRASAFYCTLNTHYRIVSRLSSVSAGANPYFIHESRAHKLTPFKGSNLPKIFDLYARMCSICLCCLTGDTAEQGPMLDPDLSERHLLTMPSLKAVMGGKSVPLENWTVVEHSFCVISACACDSPNWPTYSVFLNLFTYFLSASLYVSKRGAY